MDERRDNRMKLADIMRFPDEFLEKYQIKKEFEQSGYSWDTLFGIASQFDNDRQNKYPKIIQKYISQISKFESIHSYRYRIKETDSLIKKIITKAVPTNENPGYKVTLDNYKTIITDLLGIRVLYVFKEDYYDVHEQIMDNFRSQFVGDVQIKLQPGDDESLYSRIENCSPRKKFDQTYRSIHYTLCAEKSVKNGVRLEIQTRTIFEEAWSEINHKLVYKNQGVADYFVLLQASKILSKLVGTCDNLGMLMKEVYDEYTQKKEASYENTEFYSDKIMDEVLMKFLMH